MFSAVVDHWVTTRQLYCLYLAPCHTGYIILIWQEKEEAVGSIKEGGNTCFTLKGMASNMFLTVLSCCLYQITGCSSVTFKINTYREQITLNLYTIHQATFSLKSVFQRVISLSIYRILISDSKLPRVWVLEDGQETCSGCIPASSLMSAGSHSSTLRPCLLLSWSCRVDGYWKRKKHPQTPYSSSAYVVQNWSKQQWIKSWILCLMR